MGVRKIALITLLLAFAVPAFATEEAITAAPAATVIKFKDVPADYWAASSVYDLVKLGVTKGYPDGTFRGGKTITRYETAVFLSKLAKAIGGEDIKADIQSLKDDVVSLKKQTEGGMPFRGSYEGDWFIGNILGAGGGPRGTVATYRLQLGSEKDLAENANVKINFDTMDYGYLNDGTTTTGGVLATELLDLESNLATSIGLPDPVNLKLTYGPGPKQHAADPTGILSSEVGMTYIRPYPAVIASTKFWGADFSGGYYSLSRKVSGQVDVSKITGKIGVSLVNNLRLEATGDYVSPGMYSATSRDVRATIDLLAPVGEKVNITGTVGLGGTENKHMMVSGKVALKDPWDTGTILNIRFAKVGSAFISPDPALSRAEFDFAGYDSFNRPLENSTVNIGGELVQNVSDTVKLVGRGDVRLAGDYKYESAKGRLTAEGGVSYSIAHDTTFDARYRIYQDKATNDTSDLAALGLNYRF